MDLIDVKYKDLCPKCGKEVSSEEIEKNICKYTGERLSVEEDREYEEFKKFFKQELGVEPTSLQRYWFYRIKNRESFTINAPTGFGKTTFAIMITSFYAFKGKRSYIIVPTKTILEQVEKRLPKKLKEIIVYKADLKKKEKEELLEKIKEGKFKLLVTTAAFMSKNFEVLEDKKFDLIFCDDLDSVLKNSRNLEKLLKSLGFEKEEIKSMKIKGEEEKGQLIIATATTKKGKAVKLLRSLLGIDASQSKAYVREIYDTYIVRKPSLEILKEVLEILKDGTLIYVENEQIAKQLYEKLKEEISIGIVTSKEEKGLEEFIEGKVSFLIGIAHHYGKLVRGLDAPQRIKHVVFYGMPKFKIRVQDLKELSDKMIVMLLSYFRDIEEIRKNYYILLKDIKKAREVLRTIFEERKFENIKHIIVKEDAIIIPDLATYLQASGRTSRLYKGKVTIGLSIVIEEKEAIESLSHRAQFYNIIFKDFYELNLEKIKEEIEESRKGQEQMKDIVKPWLMIVESPTKAKQIARFFGKPAIYTIGKQVFYEILTGKHLLIITASMGHIVELITQNFFYGVEVDNENKKIIPWYDTIKRCGSCQYTDVRPKNCNCDEVRDSKEFIKNLVRQAIAIGNVIVATDPDVEGEKIAWDIKNLVMNNAKVFRAEFHEVTKKAIIEALENLREINLDLVKSQIVRRIEDRWIGFKLSQILQRKFRDASLSAGRVQTPVLGWIIERFFESKKRVLKHFLEGKDGRLLEVKDIGKLKEGKVKVDINIIEKQIIEEVVRPYTTDEVLKDINKLLKISAKEAMQILQQLFENGLITYHRTDSYRVSEKGLEVAKAYLGEYFVARSFDRGEGAHECIRPTRPIDKMELIALLREGIIKVTDKLTKKHFDVYDLIFRRFMASQTEKLKKEISKVEFEIKQDSKFIRIVEEIATKCYGKSHEIYKYSCYTYDLDNFIGEVTLKIRKFPKVVPYSEAEVIENMKVKGIGRPSTYAIIVDKLFVRKYIFEKNNRVLPTKKGILVYKYLSERFKKYVSEETTKKVQELMEEVENGEKDYLEVLWQIYEEIKGLDI